MREQLRDVGIFEESDARWRARRDERADRGQADGTDDSDAQGRNGNVVDVLAERLGNRIGSKLDASLESIQDQVTARAVSAIGEAVEAVKRAILRFLFRCVFYTVLTLVVYKFTRDYIRLKFKLDKK